MAVVPNWLDRLKQIRSGSSFAKHVMVVSGSVVIAQVISILVGPINSRLYKPADYGIFSMFSALFAVIGVVGTLQYEMALGTIEDDSEAFHLLVLCLVLTGVWTALFVIITVTAGQPFAHWISREDTQFIRYLWFLPLGIGFNSLTATFSRWAMRKRAFPQLSLVQVVSNILASSCTVTLGLFHVGLPGLIIGSILSQIYLIGKLSTLAYPEYQTQRQSFTFKYVQEVAKRHYRYPLYTTWSILLNTLSIYIPIFLLTKGFGNISTGHFSLSQRILFLPTLLISGAITPVFYSRAKQAQAEGKLSNLTLRMINSISGVNTFFPVFLGLFGEWIFVIVFGSQWRRAGQYSAALAPWVFFSFLVYPLEALPLIFNRQRTYFFFQAVQFVLRAGALLLGITFKNDLLAMWLLGSTSALFMLVYFIWLFKLVDGPVFQVLKKLVKDTALALVCFGGCRLLLAYSHNNAILTSCCLIPMLITFIIRGIRQILRANPEMLNTPKLQLVAKS